MTYETEIERQRRLASGKPPVRRPDPDRYQRQRMVREGKPEYGCRNLAGYGRNSK